ncbi:MAG: HD domain-containing phosphohydrolase [Nitrospirota bacterium]
MVKIYHIDDEAERYIPITLDELVPGTQISFEIFCHDGTMIKSLLDKGATYSLFAQKMIEKQAVGRFFIRQGSALNLNEYMHNAAKLKRMLLDPHFFESRYREFRDKWFVVDKQVLNSGIPFDIRLGGLRFPVFGEIPFSVDNNATYRHLLDLNSDIAVRKQDVDAYYTYLDTILDAEWIEDPLLKLRARREKLNVWCYRVLEEASGDGIRQDTLLKLYKHISIVLKLLINDFSYAGNFLFFDVSDVFLPLHSVNVCLLSMIVGHMMNREESALFNLGIAAVLHDVGRVAINDEGGEDAPSGAARELFKSHVVKGHEILAPCSDVPRAAKVVALTHHEHVDGSGYVYGLTGERIHPFSKIVGVVDTFENRLVTDFRHASLKRAEIIEMMARNGGRFDPDVLAAFIRFMAGVALL